MNEDETVPSSSHPQTGERKKNKIKFVVFKNQAVVETKDFRSTETRRQRLRQKILYRFQMSWILVKLTHDIIFGGLCNL